MTASARLEEIGAAIAADALGAAPFRDFGAEIPDLAAAYAAQAAMVTRHAGAHGGVGGRKIAWNTEAQMTQMGLSEPGVGCIPRDLIRRGEATLRAGDYRSFAIEPEIAAVLGADLAPRAGGHDRASVADAIARLHPAFELLDRREVGDASPRAMIASNIFNAGLVLGGPGLPPGDVDPDDLRSIVTRDGEVILDRRGAAPMHPLDAAAFIATRFNLLGETVAAGSVLLLGAHLAPHAITGPARLRFSLGALGEAGFDIA